MKAILVIDMPKDCWDCRLVSEFHSCRGTVLQNDFGFRDITNFDKGERPSWCPLKPMPQRQNKDEEKSSLEYIYEADTLDEFQSRCASYLYGHIDGWNACLKEIEK